MKMKNSIEMLIIPVIEINDVDKFSDDNVLQKCADEDDEVALISQVDKSKREDGGETITMT